jgi:hypothetical protein
MNNLANQHPLISEQSLKQANMMLVNFFVRGNRFQTIRSGVKKGADTLGEFRVHNGWRQAEQAMAGRDPSRTWLEVNWTHPSHNRRWMWTILAKVLDH